jgi:hypothetical protein
MQRTLVSVHRRVPHLLSLLSTSLVRSDFHETLRVSTGLALLTLRKKDEKRDREREREREREMKDGDFVCVLVAHVKARWR